MLYGGIEAGGTKFICAVSDEQLHILERVSIPTTKPEETMTAVFAFFDQYDLQAIGVGSFGPIDVNPTSDIYGYITSTPKLAWTNFNFLGTLREHYQVPIAWTTDVNAAAYGELKKGAAQGKKSCIYITVGTGIGGGAVVNGQILSGFGHPEMGHIFIQKHPDDHFEGNCPFHKGNCLEGLAAGPAIEGRTGKKAQMLSAENPAWEIEADYLGQAILDYSMCLSPEMIIFGGGVMKQQHLFPKMRAAFKKQLNQYLGTPPLNQYIVPCQLGDDAGIMGCLLLAIEEV